MPALHDLRKILIAAGCFALLVSAPALFGQGKRGGGGDAAKGKELFEANCSVCHNSDSEETKVGPGLKGLFKHDKLLNGKKVTEESVKEMINEGGGGMPSFSDMLKDDEKDNLVAFLKTL